VYGQYKAAENAQFNAYSVDFKQDLKGIEGAEFDDL
jgi:hypothetical protein